VLFIQVIVARHVGSVCVAVWVLLVSGCSSAEFLVANAPADLSRVERRIDLSYGTNRRQNLDVYEPRKAADLPVVIFWYGGSWIEGSKADYRFVGTELAQLGFVAVLPDYRLFPEVTFPLFDEDGARAVAWVQKHAKELGGDPKRIVLMGHSAGGHTAAFLAFNHAFLERFGADSHSIVGFIGLSGTYTFVPDSDVLRAAFPPPFTEKDWQPIRFVDAQSPPTLLLHGLADTEVMPQEAIDLRDALMQAKVRVELHLFPHRGHGATVAPFALVARWHTPVVKEVAEFIRSVSGERAAGGT
jgi:acetyl esterase/lipase